MAVNLPRYLIVVELLKLELTRHHQISVICVTLVIKHINYWDISTTFCLSIEMDNRGEVSQILNGVTFDGNNIFDAGKS